MVVRVLLFASLRDSAGTGQVEVAAAPLATILDGLRDRFGEPFASRLAVSSVLVDGDTTARDAVDVVPDGAEVVLLPPVSGGAGTGVAPPAAAPSADPSSARHRSRPLHCAAG